MLSDDFRVRLPGSNSSFFCKFQESAVERSDIKEPFSEVSMFKKNFDHLPKETYFGHYKESTRGNPNYFLTYGNGKAAARIQNQLRPNGAHRWHNYVKHPQYVSIDVFLLNRVSLVLYDHFASLKLSTERSKWRRLQFCTTHTRNSPT